jgi:hypothetical protein
VFQEFKYKNVDFLRNGAGGGWGGGDGGGGGGVPVRGDDGIKGGGGPIGSLVTVSGEWRDGFEEAGKCGKAIPPLNSTIYIYRPPPKVFL